MENSPSALRIIFMGTPEFAVPSLDILVQHHFQVVAVITAPDKPQGRGQKMMPSAVKEAAERLGIPLLQPTHLKSPEFIQALREYQADLQVVVAFRMLPEAVWAMPSRGTFNLHASLLPHYRGAAPINWALINGEKETGVTTFFLQHAIDTGHIILQEREPIYDTDDAGALYDRLKKRGAQVVLKTVELIARGTCVPQPQTTTGLERTAPKIFKDTCRIEWNQPAEDVRNFVRGLSPYPGAWTVWRDTTCKIFKVEHAPDFRQEAPPGALAAEGGRLYARAADGWLSVEELQPEGRRRMTGAEFLRGRPLTP